MSYLSKVSTFVNTIKYFKPSQVYFQIRNKLPSKDFITCDNNLPTEHIHLSLFIEELDADETYVDKFKVDKILKDLITLLNQTFRLEFSTWTIQSASHLLSFNLHYLEYCIPLAVRYKETGRIDYAIKLRQIIESWIETGYALPDASHSYTISLRIVNLLIVDSICGEQLSDTRERLYKSIFLQYRYLLKHQEKQLLGNHYFENLKTIIVCSLVFGDDRVYKRYIRHFLREVQEQILSDGVHFELSVMYHKIILEDIIRVAYMLRQVGKPECRILIPVIQTMIDAIFSLEYGMGQTPLFNDSGDNVAKTSSQLCAAAKRLFYIEPNFKDTFPASGYYKLYGDNISLLFDVGRIGPDYMPGHGHCDCLSFELSVNNTPLFVNSGTYQYQGDKRAYFRSTRAHNTIAIGRREQSECWGEHRVARRIRNVQAERDGNLVTGSYVTYLGDKHIRTLSLLDSALSIQDSTTAIPNETIHSYLHIAPCYTVSSEEGTVFVELDDQSICSIEPIACEFIVHTSNVLCYYAPEFGIIQNGICIEFVWQSDALKHGYTINFHKEG